MQIIAIYGKGGIGKSTISANLSFIFSKKGLRVLHIGCDPKRDSCMMLTDGERIPTILERELYPDKNKSSNNLIYKTRHGVHCLESGGPAPGMGCGGRGIARTLEVIDSNKWLLNDDYDIAVFDVLGDVVCGGFAAPLKKYMLEKNVFIVVSEEMMAMYAANNIIRAIRNFEENNARAAGLIVNLKAPDSDTGIIESFSKKINVGITHILCRDSENMKSEFEYRAIVESNPQAKLSGNLLDLSEKMLDIINTGDIPAPSPMDEEEFFSWSRKAGRPVNSN